jgi:hypothetical protein
MPAEALSALRRRLVALPARHPERSTLMASTAQLYAVSRATLYRLLRGERRPKDAHRADRGRPATVGRAQQGALTDLLFYRADTASVSMPYLLYVAEDLVDGLCNFINGTKGRLNPIEGYNKTLCGVRHGFECVGLRDITGSEDQNLKSADFI